jgi:hypothetical protein
LQSIVDVKKDLVFKSCCEINVFTVVQFAGFFIFLLGRAFISLHRVTIFV